MNNHSSNITMCLEVPNIAGNAILMLLAKLFSVFIDIVLLPCFVAGKHAPFAEIVAGLLSCIFRQIARTAIGNPMFTLMTISIQRARSLRPRQTAVLEDICLTRNSCTRCNWSDCSSTTLHSTSYPTI